MTGKLLCGVDLGGTKLAVGLYTPEGRLIADRKVKDHAGLGNDEMTDRIADLVEALLKEEGVEESDLAGIGVGMAAHINSAKGMVITVSNFAKPFRRYPLGIRLGERFSVPVVLDNDANAQAYGEYTFGAGKGRRDMVFITVSTGVGAGIIVGGRLLRGHSGFAGEVGHTIVDSDSRIRCTCGNYGCLMALSSGLGLAERYRLYLEEGMTSSLGIHADAIPVVDGHFLEEGWKTGDEISRRIVEDSARYVGIGIYNVYQTINPQTVVLGGGLMKMGPEYLRMITETFRSLVHDMVDEELEIVLTALGDRGGLLGAATLPLEAR